METERTVAAVDLGSGTVKWSLFVRASSAWEARELEEINTELRKGMLPEWRLQPGPIADTLKACAGFRKRADALGLARLPAYGTSALRKARNREALFEPLKALGLEPSLLSPEDEGRLNLLGCLAREGKDAGVLVMDPGGDSTEICSDLSGRGWSGAEVASLPFGSVSLQERFGGPRDNAPIPWDRLVAVSAFARDEARRFPPAAQFLGAGRIPSIRINLPIQRALEAVHGLPAAPPGAGGDYPRCALEALTRAAAAADRPGRAAMMAGEPLGKVDRSCYGFASWLGALDALGADTFRVEPWGIKLGAALALNLPSSSVLHG